jgi:hypothetical protein
LLGRSPELDEWADLLDFAGTEWVDEQGHTVAETLAAEPGLAELARWPTEVRTSLWVVDGTEGPMVLLRDLQNDAEVAVTVPMGVLPELPARTVLRARVVPWRGASCFFGEPGLYGQPGVLARMGLLEQWRQGGEPALLVRLAQLRSDWSRMRDQRRVFLSHFGGDFAQFESAEAMELAIAEFLDRLLNADRGCDGTTPTRRERYHAERGTMPQDVQMLLGDTMRGGRPAMCFDSREGLLFLPAFGELKAHLDGSESHPDILHLWMSNHELPAQGLARAGLPPLALQPIVEGRPPRYQPIGFPEFEPPER